MPEQQLEVVWPTHMHTNIHTRVYAHTCTHLHAHTCTHTHSVQSYQPKGIVLYKLFMSPIFGLHNLLEGLIWVKPPLLVAAPGPKPSTGNHSTISNSRSSGVHANKLNPIPVFCRAELCCQILSVSMPINTQRKGLRDWSRMSEEDRTVGRGNPGWGDCVDTVWTLDAHRSLLYL